MEDNSVENSREEMGEAEEFEEDVTGRAWCQANLEMILRKKEKWIKVDDFDVCPGCPTGENFVADVIRVIVYGRRLCLGTWTDFRKNFIVKKMPSRYSINHRFHNCFRLFENEIVAYEKILPQCQNYLDGKWRNEMGEFCFPKYYGQCRMFIVLQDLQAEGYQVVNRVKGFSKRECSIVLQELSKFHAISISMKKRDKIGFWKMANELRESIFLQENSESIAGIFWENSLEFAVRSLSESNDFKLKKISEKLRIYSGKVLETLIKSIESNFDKFDVICHGDLWNNNILFRYCDSGYPIGVKFIDLQGMRSGSCVLDVMHVLFTSSRPSVFEKHFDVLLGEYYDFLSDNLANMGESIDFTYGEFREELKSRILFGTLLASLMFTFLTKTSVSGAELNLKMKKFDSDSEKEKIYKSFNSGYHERLRSLFLTLEKFNMI